MTAAPARARRPVSRAAARWAVLSVLLALVLGLGMGFAHASAAPTVDAQVGISHHAPVLGTPGAMADPACASCGDHEEGAMIACLVSLVVVALFAALRPAPGARLVLRRPFASASVVLPRVPGRTPDLAELGICRT